MTLRKLIKHSLSIVCVTLLITACQRKDNQLQVVDSNGTVEIDNGLIKAKFFIANNILTQQYFATNKNEWALVAESFVPPAQIPSTATQLFNSTLDQTHRFLVSENLNRIEVTSQSKDSVIVKLSGRKADTPIQQLVTLYLNQDYHLAPV